MNATRFKITAYLRLAELCTASETEKRKQYMEIVEKLLNDCNDDDFKPKAPAPNTSVYTFVKDCEEIGYQITNEPVPKVYTEYKGYCNDNGLTSIANSEFSKQIHKLLNLCTIRKRIDGSRNLTSIFVEP